MSVDCASSTYSAYAAISAIYIIFYVFGTMALVVSRLRHNYRTGNLLIPSHPAHQKYAFFFIGYRSSMYFWEAVIMLRKMGIVAFSVLATPGLELLFGIVIITVSLLLNTNLLPFASHFVNRLDTLALTALYCTVVLGFFFLLNSGSNIWVAVLLILINGATIAFLFACCLHRLREYISKLERLLPDKWRPAETIEMHTRSSRPSTKAALDAGGSDTVPF
jgi:hypothetical protein